MIKHQLIAFAVAVALPQGYINPRAQDGDSLKWDGTSIRLYGIDAPELSQTCKNKNDDLWKCGRDAREAMKDMVKNGVVCEQEDYDSKYNRPVAICMSKDGVDVGQQLVRQGLALAYRHYSDKYVKDEDIARAEGVGMWSGKFIEPWQWRRGERW